MSEKLEELSSAVRGRQAFKKQVQLEADEWVKQKMAERNELIEKLVIDALADHSVMSVAEAYTISGKTPNRNAIHEIKRRRGLGGSQKRFVSDIVLNYPFEWVDREITTISGTKTVWDVRAICTDFGPDQISGIFRWRADGGELDPVLTEEEPYPNSKYYQSVLSAWLESNPYPGEQEN